MSQDDPKEKSKAAAGAPNVSELTDEEYQREYEASLQGDEKAPKAESPVKSWWERFNGVMSKQRDPLEVVRSAARGVENAGIAAAQTVAEMSVQAALPGTKEPGKKLGQKVASAGNKVEDAVLGKRSDDGLAAFTESATQFMAGFAAVGGGTGFAAGLARGALVDATMFDPYEAQLAELAARTKVPGLKQLGELLSVEGDDSPVVARLKRAAAGAIPGAVVDGLVAGVRGVKAGKKLAGGATGAEKKAAQETLEINAKIVKDVAEGTHVADGSHVKVVENGDGTFTVQPRADANGDLGVAPKFKDKAEALQQAESMDAAIQDLLDKGNVAFDPDALHDMIASDMPDEFFLKVSSHNTVDEDLELVAKLSESIIAKRSALEATTGGSITIEQGKRLAKETLEKIPEGQLHETIKKLLRANPESQDIVSVMADMVLGQKGRNIVQLHDVLEARPHDPVAMEQLQRAIINYFDLRDATHMGESAGARRLRFVQERDVMRKETFKTADDATKAKVENAATVADETAPKVETPEVKPAEPAKADAEAPKVAGMNTRPASQLVLDEQNARIIARMFKLAGGAPTDVDAVIRGATVMQNGGAGRVVLEVFTNSLLSGPPTWATVLVSGQAISLAEVASKIVGGAMSGNKALVREGADTLFGLYSHLSDNIKIAAMAMRNGQSIINPAPMTYAIGGLTGKIVRTPGNIMMGLDEFTRVANYRAYVRAKSLRAGREAGLSGSALAKRVDDDLRAAFDPETGIATIPQALKYADVATLSSGLQPGFGRALQNFTNDALMAKFIAPFVRATTNIWNYAWQSTPGLNLFNKQAREIILKGGDEAAALHARSAMATTIGLFAYTKAMQGEVTGKGPSDPDLRKAWLKNNQPYSIRVGDKWISYNRLDPIATPIGMIADIYTFSQELGEEHMDVEEATYAVLASLAANFGAKTYMRGIADFMEAWSKGDPATTGRYLQRQGSSLVVPNLANKLNPDPYYREVESMLDAIKSRMPYFSETLDPRHDIFGEKVLKAEGLANRAVNPFTVKEAKESKVEQELLAIGKSLAPYPDKIGNGMIDLHSKEYNERADQPSPYVRLMELVRNPGNGRKSLREAMEDAIKSPTWNTKSDGTEDFKGGEKLAKLAGLKERYESRALRQVLREYPKLDDHYKTVQRARGAAFRGGEDAIERLEERRGPIRR